MNRVCCVLQPLVSGPARVRSGQSEGLRLTVWLTQRSNPAALSWHSDVADFLFSFFFTYKTIKETLWILKKKKNRKSWSAWSTGEKNKDPENEMQEIKNPHLWATCHARGFACWVLRWDIWMFPIWIQQCVNDMFTLVVTSMTSSFHSPRSLVYSHCWSPAVDKGNDAVSLSHSHW